MKNKKILIGFLIVLFIGIVNGCLVDTVYEDDFSDNVVNYNYWTNLTGGVIWSETGGYMKIVHGVGIPSHSRYSLDTGNSQLLLDARLQYYTGNPPRHASMFFWDGKYGVQCWATKLSTTYYLHCRAVPAYASMECNTFSEIIVHQGASNPSHNYRFSTALNQLNFSIDGVLEIQCNNTFQNDFSDVKLEFIQNDTPQSTFEAYIYDFAHGNKTNYHKLTWKTLDYFTHEPIKDLNITITHVQNSNYPPIPQNCVTNSDGKCVFLFDYFCNMSCDEVIMIEADLIDIYNRTPSIPYDFFGIGRDEFGDHNIITYHVLTMFSHDVEFIIQDYSFQPIINASVELEHGGIVKHCYTNSSGKCKIQAINGVAYTATIKKPQYKTKSDIIILTSMMPYDINRTYYLSTKYVNEVDLLISGWNMTGNAIGLNDSEIKLSYISGYPEYIGFSWIPAFNNSIANIYGLPKGTYEITVNNIEDYCILEWGIPVESKTVTLNLPNEYLGIFIKYYDYQYNFTGNVYTSFTWDDWNNHIYNPSVSAEIMLYNDKHNYIDYTDSNGFFNFSNVSKGVYTLHIRHDGVHQEYFESINIDKNIHKNYYITPDLPPVMKNVSIFGYVLYNNTPLANVDILFSFAGWEYTYYTNLLGYYNFTDEVPIGLPYHVEIIYNQDNYPEYEPYYRNLLIDENHLWYTGNISLMKKTLLWNIHGHFVDENNNPVFLDYQLKGSNINYTVNNTDLIIQNMQKSGTYTLKLSGLIHSQEFDIILPDDITIWKTENGIWDLGNIVVYSVARFGYINVVVKNNNSEPIIDAIVSLDDVNHNFYFEETNTKNFGEAIFNGVPMPDKYSIIIEKDNYITITKTVYISESKIIYITLLKGSTTEESIQNMIEEWALILVGLIMCVIFLFFGSMLFEFLDKIGGK